MKIGPRKFKWFLYSTQVVVHAFGSLILKHCNAFICTISERHNHLCIYTLHESLSKVHNVLIQRGYAKGNVHNFIVITVYRKTFASGVFFFGPFSIHCLWASLRLGKFEWFKLFLNTTLSRWIQERAKLFASKITLYTCTLPELWQIFKVWILKDFNLVYKL